ncbi:sodium:solute symporter family transporter [Tuwongella immobilis]|uniref:Sodium:solute symporter family protein n=1 Tax=Tuwongella immobilis TaxID=692036 RepID=A0A6C2YX83_9BACT|nr:hypothetical protein [Tuwongella immobilis]VIP05432.1 sodium panthothenate symporter : Na+/panthothenate symporter OS=Singulisphaera acidiphila (strain ATCC BAA-1392 / DSM 18658 / VKM B-2454 / MOB10) GN=Sinac_5998 PE=3 SV=1: SSF: SSF [Tuwongella immobilis]VTS08220.1 sodium panthothenate symporter : Na+/panthothenate symporter OS=Singulisphaera acidiphila (strain ATCC BAA-1392 / DSM 18658 / VKM B-2454 / MOB10) GN=Sinac_5998 PE=3 SV=1: SSF: SSF [Tuwongella immobilis]
MLDIPAAHYWVILAFALYLIGVMVFSFFSHRVMSKGSFVNSYFLGNRGLGGWVLALTVAATAVSGGTFMGFPSLIYTNGWVMALWICSYMVVPLTAMALMGKRINQVARISGAVTMPDVFRDRFQSPTLGILATLLILLFLTFNLVAQFKAGGLVLREAIRLNPPPAEVLEISVSPERQLVVKFSSNGNETTQRTAMPTKTAQFIGHEVDPDARAVRVKFVDDGREMTKLVRFPAELLTIPGFGWKVEKGYLIGLLLFAFTVIAYTTYGGFWAVTMTDVFEGLVMLGGVLLMAILAINAVPTAPSGATGLAAANEWLIAQDPALVYGPGFNGFLPLGMAFSFYLMWSMSSAGQPSGMVRLMAFKDTGSLRRALVLVAFYYMIVYSAIIIIFICARAIFPTEYLREMGSEGEPDAIMPAMALKVAPSPFLAGLLLAAPYAAIMSTVAAFLLMISSSLVRDLYQRSLNPNASQKSMKILSYSVTALVGVVVMLGAMNPPSFLQYIIVFTGSGQSCAFLMPMLFLLFWKRTTKAGALAGMLLGVGSVLGLYALGWIDNRTQDQPDLWVRSLLGWLPGWGEIRSDKFAPLTPLGLDPLFWGMIGSLLGTVLVSKITRSDPAQTARYFPE